MNGFANLWNAIGQPITNASGQIVNALMADIGRPFQACVMAWLLIELMIAMWSPDNDAFNHFFKSIALAAVIFTLATNVANFNYYVTGVATWLVNTVMNAIGGIFGQAPGNVSAATFDAISVKCYGLGLKVFKLVPWYSLTKSIPLGIVVVAYWFLTSAAILMMFLCFLVASVSMVFVIAFGPIFIALAFFPYTRRFFDGWVAAVVGSVLTQIFVLTLLALFTLAMNALLQPLIDNLAAGGADDGGIIIAGLQNLILAVGIGLIFAILTYFAGKLAVSIAGTVGVQMPRVPIYGFGRAAGTFGGGGGRGSAGAAGASGPAGSAGGSGPAGGGVGGQRAYAFNKTVGTAN